MAKVLVIEDDAVIADGIVQHLSAAGFETWALTPDPAAAPIWSLELPARVAIMLGAEGPGLSPGALAILEAMSEAAALSRAYELAPTDVLDVVVGSLFDVPSIGSTRG